jgi:hypothetical protein
MAASPLIIGLLAGLGSALLFASATSGTVLAALLFYAAPLPLFVAGTGFGRAAILASTAVATLVTGLALGLWIGAVFAVSVAIPSGLLARLLLLSRPVNQSDPSAGLEWYPVGRLVLWAAALGVVVLATTIPVFGFREGGYHAELGGLIADMLRTGQGPALVPEGANIERIASVLAMILPPAAAAMWTATTLANLWLGTRVVAASGRLPRPWPKLSDLDYPPPAAAIFAAAIAASFLPGIPGMVARLAFATLFIAYLLLGLATLHQLTERATHRGLMLTATYFALLALSWTAVFVAGLGLAENILRLRRRRARQGTPTRNNQTPPPT